MSLENLMILSDKNKKIKKEASNFHYQNAEDRKAKPGDGTGAALVLFFLVPASTWLIIGWGSMPPRSKWHS